MMRKNHSTNILRTRLIAALLTIFALGACSRPSDTTPTVDPGMIQTQAVSTFAAGLTETSATMPTATPTLTPSPTPTITATATQSPSSTPGILPTTSCYNLAFVSDVTIPDNTKMSQGENFTKTWRVKNNGSCDWEKGYQVKFFSGNSMSGKTINLENAVEAGTQLDISVAMTAPQTTGVYTGNWRMTDDSGSFFGDSFYVMIQVVQQPSPTTSAPTATAPPATAPPATAEPSPTTEPTETPSS